MGLGAEVLCAGARVVHVLDSDSEALVIVLVRGDVRRIVRHWWPHGSLRSLQAISPHVARTTWGG